MRIEVILNDNLPENILYTLRNLADGNEREVSVIHNPLWLWKHHRNPLVNYNGIHYTQFYYCQIHKRYVLMGYGDIKNYEDEYQEFLRIFKPYFYCGLMLSGEPNYFGYFELDSHDYSVEEIQNQKHIINIERD